MGPRGPEETMMSQPEVASLYGGPATRRVRTRDLLAAKERGEKWAMLTSYDQYTAGIFDGAGIPVLLVGDSAANNVYGYETTLQVTVDELLPLVKAVVRATRRTLVVGDMPFGSYEEGPAQALRTAVRFMKEGGCHAVKLEGGRRCAPQIAALTAAGIPVMAHIGFTPQSEHALGGYRVQGRGDAADEVIADAHAVSEAGAFAVVLEMVPGEVAKQITHDIPMPIVGIGMSWVICLATSPGTISSTTAKAPASLTACASAMTSSAASPRPCTRYPPSACSLCGVKPMCAITGMPAAVSAAICGAQRRRPLLVGAERHVADDQGAARGADHRLHQRQELVHGHLEGGLVAVHVVGGRVADQQHRDPGAVEDAGGVLVVAGEHRPLLAAFLGGEQVTGAYPSGCRASVQRGHLGLGHHRLLGSSRPHRGVPGLLTPMVAPDPAATAASGAIHHSRGPVAHRDQGRTAPSISSPRADTRDLARAVGAARPSGRRVLPGGLRRGGGLPRGRYRAP